MQPTNILFSLFSDTMEQVFQTHNTVIVECLNTYTLSYLALNDFLVDIAIDCWTISIPLHRSVDGQSSSYASNP